MKIALKKIKIEDIEIIQSKLLKFIRHKVDEIAHCKDYEKYCNKIIVIDTLQSMFFIFRTLINHKILHRKITFIVYTYSMDDISRIF